MVVLRKVGRWGVLVAGFFAWAAGCQGSEAGEGGAAVARADASAPTVPAPQATPAQILQAQATPAMRPGMRPALVPADFVPTPNGYFHPSCLVTLGEDELLGRDLVVRGLDGVARRSVPACAYPHFTPLGRAIAPESSAPADATGAPPPACSSLGAGCSTGTTCCSGTCTGSTCDQFYDGWTVAYWWYAGNLPPEPTLTGKWVVPPSPTGDVTTAAGGDPVTLYYFNDVEMEQSSTVDILQPVLGYGYPWGNQWTITAWNCCTTGIQVTSTAVDVNPGDLIVGVTAGTDCDSASVCQTWTVTATDVTTGKSTKINTTEPNPANVVNPAVLEAYGVTACDLFAPGGQETFFDTTLTAGADAGELSLTYKAQSNPNAGTPACGYAGTSSGDSYTIIYSTSPAVDATTTALVASPTTAALGAAVTLTATVTSATTSPTMLGNVTFYDGATAIGSADVTGGTASVAVSTLAGGTHQLTAAYGGDNDYGPSTSPAASVTVTKITTTTALTAAGPTTVQEGTSIALTATVTEAAAAGTAPAPTGTVAFTSNATSLGSAPLGAGGTATLTLKDVGTFAVIATYSGDADYSGSASPALAASIGSTMTVTPATATTTSQGTLTFSATGGLGAVTWSLKTNASGGTVDASGHYTAGAKGGVTDVVAATDSDDAIAMATVTVGLSTIGQDGGSGPGGSGDAGSGDGGSGHGGTGGGCGCTEVGRSSSGGAGALAVLGLGLLVRRRPARRRAARARS